MEEDSRIRIPEGLEYLSADINDIYFDLQQRSHIAEDKAEICNVFEKYIKGVEFQKKMESLKLKVVSITPFGSSATPLASQSGDLDLCIWLKPDGFRPNKKNKKEDDDDTNEHNMVLRELCTQLKYGSVEVKKARGWKTPLHIKKAKVPIVKAHIYGYDIDISVHIGELQHPNTCAARLIQAYHLFNPNFVVLCFYIKEWFKYVVDSDAKGLRTVGSILPNSYTIVLLVAQFMQEKNMLPKLLSTHANGFFLPSNQSTFPPLFGDGGITDEEIASFKDTYATELSEQLGVTLYRFLTYLTVEIDLKHSVLSVEDGKFLPYEQVYKEGEYTHELMIVDVFDKYNPGRRVKTIGGFIHFLMEAKLRLENAHNPIRVSDRLFDMTIDLKLIERMHRINLKNAKSVFAVQALHEQLSSIIGDERASGQGAKNNRPGNGERRRKRQQQHTGAVAIPPEVAPDGQPIMPSRPGSTRRQGGGGSRLPSSAKGAPKHHNVSGKITSIS